MNNTSLNYSKLDRTKNPFGLTQYNTKSSFNIFADTSPNIQIRRIPELNLKNNLVMQTIQSPSSTFISSTISPSSSNNYNKFITGIESRYINKHNINHKDNKGNYDDGEENNDGRAENNDGREGDNDNLGSGRLSTELNMSYLKHKTNIFKKIKSKSEKLKSVDIQKNNYVSDNDDIKMLLTQRNLQSIEESIIPPKMKVVKKRNNTDFKIPKLTIGNDIDNLGNLMLNLETPKSTISPLNQKSISKKISSALTTQNNFTRGTILNYLSYLNSNTSEDVEEFRQKLKLLSVDNLQVQENSNEKGMIYNGINNKFENNNVPLKTIDQSKIHTKQLQQNIQNYLQDEVNQNLPKKQKSGHSIHATNLLNQDNNNNNILVSNGITSPKENPTTKNLKNTTRHRKYISLDIKKSMSMNNSRVITGNDKHNVGEGINNSKHLKRYNQCDIKLISQIEKLVQNYKIFYDNIAKYKCTEENFDKVIGESQIILDLFQKKSNKKKLCEPPTLHKLIDNIITITIPQKNIKINSKGQTGLKNNNTPCACIIDPKIYEELKEFNKRIEELNLEYELTGIRATKLNLFKLQDDNIKKEKGTLPMILKTNVDRFIDVKELCELQHHEITPTSNYNLSQYFMELEEIKDHDGLAYVTPRNKKINEQYDVLYKQWYQKCWKNGKKKNIIAKIDQIFPFI